MCSRWQAERKPRFGGGGLAWQPGCPGAASSQLVWGEAQGRRRDGDGAGPDGKGPLPGWRHGKVLQREAASTLCLLANPLEQVQRVCWEEAGLGARNRCGYDRCCQTYPLCCPGLAYSQRSLLILGVKLCRGGSPSTLQLIDKLSCHSNAFSTYHKE